MHRLFVFGTLKSGFPLHDAGLRGATCLGAYRTVERYPMFVAGRWFAPMMLHRPGAGLIVKGELYEVNDAQLAALDTLESVGKPGNFRVSIEVERVDGGERCAAFAYVKAPELATLAHTEYLDDYQDRRFIPVSRRA
jgi:gamma-glutamylaminecyclotransferase